MKCIETSPGDFISKEAFICILALCYVYVMGTVVLEARSMIGQVGSAYGTDVVGLLPPFPPFRSGNTDDRISYMFSMYTIVYAAERFVWVWAPCPPCFSLAIYVC